MKPLRRVNKLMPVVLSVMMLLSGCLALSPTESCEFGVGVPPSEKSEGGAVVLFHAAEDFPDAANAIVQSEILRASLPKTEKQVPFTLAIAAADGSPSVLFQSWINLELGDIELDLEQKRNRAQSAIGNVYNCSFSESTNLGKLDENVDIIGGLRVAGGALASVDGEKLLLIFSNGIQTAGEPNFSKTFPRDFEDADAMVDVLESGNALPDLKGIRVEWVGLGQVTSGRPALEQQAINILEYFWTQLILRSGGLPPEKFATGALGSVAPQGAPSTLELAEIKGLCFFTLDEASGFTFQPDSAEFVNLDLARAGAESIARQILESDCGSRPLRVTGFTASGTSKAKYESQSTAADSNLSKARAQAFASLLAELGLDVREVVGGGKGPVNDWDQEGEFVEELGKKNRIVRIEEIR